MLKHTMPKNPTPDEIVTLIAKYEMSTPDIIEALAQSYEKNIGKPYCDSFADIAKGLREFKSRFFLHSDAAGK